MKKNNDEIFNIDTKELATSVYKKEFENLTDYEKKLLAYRKIIGLVGEEEKFFSNEMDEIFSIIKASDYSIGFIEALMTYAMCDDAYENKKIFSESLISYNKILENYRLLAEELNIDNSLDLSHLFTYMLWNGYYSVSGKHSYKLQDRLLLTGMNSFDVIKGRGVCLAYSELLHNYLTVCGIKSAILNCRVPTKKNAISSDYRPDIKRNIGSSFSSKISSKMAYVFLNGLINKIGNHAVTLIYENDKLFVYDPTNLYVLNVINESTASIINGKGSFEIKPFSSLMLEPNSDPNMLFNMLVSNNIEPAFTRKEVIFSFENIMELIQSNIQLLDDAYHNIHSELVIIDKQTDEFGGYSKVLRRIK